MAFMAKTGFNPIDHRAAKRGFTLIELSIVLVIIGLIIGGVLVGKDLIAAAAVRAQIAQIEKYNASVNTFRSKYGYLPGDIPEPAATQYGFKTRGTQPGQGDGDGLLEGTGNAGGPNGGTYENVGELAMLWVDLSAAKLIDGSFSTASPVSETYTVLGDQLITLTSTPSLTDMYPRAKMGNNNYILAWSGGWGQSTYPGPTHDGFNYFEISAPIQLNSWNAWANPGLSVAEAYNIDRKADDGLPQSGRITAQILNGGSLVQWASNNAVAIYGTPDTSATPATDTTCFDNGGAAGVQHYSMGWKGGALQNCGLSFRMQ